MVEICQLDKDRRFDVQLASSKKLGLDLSANVTVHLWGVMGDRGSLQLLPLHSRLTERREQFENNAPESKWDASADERARVLRQLSSFVPVSCVRHGQYMRCTLPADVVSFGLFDPPQKIAFVSLDEIAEIWPVAQWREAVRIADLRAFTEEVDRILG